MSECKKKVQDIILKDEYPCRFREKNKYRIKTFPKVYICTANDNFLHNEVSFSDCKYCHFRKQLKYLADLAESVG